MWSKYLKKTLVFSVVAAGIFMFVFSCENPFATSFGEKVDIEPPKLFNITPVSGALLKDVVEFTGDATAYRELRSVEVKIYNPEFPKDETKFLGPQEWTAVDFTASRSAKEKSWSFTLDTTDADTRALYAYTDSAGKPQNGLDDGFLYVRFRAKDPNLTAPTEQLVFIIKNGPSTISMIMPDKDGLIDKETGILFTTSQRELSPKEGVISGSIIDRRGIKPGFPQIKLWKTTDSEPADGWAQMFLTGVGVSDSYDGDVDVYTDRNEKQVVNVANFKFKLAPYTINPTTRQVTYTRTGTGVNLAFAPFPTGDYYFKIRTRDTFFYDDVNDSSTYRKPRDPLPGEEETRAYSPEGALDAGGNKYIFEVKESELKPYVEVDNDDIAPAVLAAEPHIYINQSTAKKIILPVPNPNPNPRTDFRLRVKAYNAGLVIRRAELHWAHEDGRSGRLPWDNVYDETTLTSLGYYKDENTTTVQNTDQGAGHLGAWKNVQNQAEGKVFQFTAKNGMKDSETNEEIFTSSTERYTLTVTVWPVGSSNPTVQPFTLFLDEEGPRVSINQVKGAFSNTATTDPAEVTGGTIDTDFYSVNGNIQVLIDSATNIGIAQIKWAVEAAASDTETEAQLYANTNSLYRKLRNFRDNPTGANASFFNALETTNTSGLVTRMAPGDVKDSFKMNVRGWVSGNTYKWDDKQDLWLYIIAQDGVNNLGYAVQKLKVDESKDVPVLKITGLAATVEDDPEDPKTAVTSAESLYIDINSSNEPSKAMANVLNLNQDIELFLSDDDAFKPSEVSIKLTSYNLLDPPNNTNNTYKEVTFDAEGMVGSDIQREKNTILTQALMAKELGYVDNPATENVDESLSYLPDGVYTIVITLPDHLSSKISGAGLAPVAVATKTKTIHFVVYDQKPQIEVLFPVGENSTQIEGDKTVHGTVKSRLKIQKLEITFTPGINASPAIAGSRTENLPLYINSTHTQLAPTAWKTARPDADGNYIYYWTKTVNFANVPSTFDPNNVARFFNLQTWDGLGERGVADRTVQIDRQPPTIGLVAFNWSRLYYDSNVARSFNTVNGKVPFDINVFDLNGIGPERPTGYNPQEKLDDPVNIKWFVLPNAAAVPTWDTVPTGSGRGGQLTNRDNRGGSIYRVVLDTTVTPSTPPGLSAMATGLYRLYVIAEDTAGNRSAAVSLISPTEDFNTQVGQPAIPVFRIDQESDKPVLLPEFTPPNGLGYTLGGGSSDLKLTGSIYDDDEFDPTKTGTAPYVQIRFPLNNSNTGNWGRWRDVPVTIDSATGYLKYEFPLASVTDQDYFSGASADGEKYYQLKITDEAVRGAVDAQGNYKPEGKNPDGVTTGNGAIPAKTVYLIGEGNSKRLDNEPAINSPINAANAFCFNYKNSNPEVFFNNFDPNACHRLGHNYNAGHNHSPSNPATGSPNPGPADFNPNYPVSDSRPTYNQLSSLRADLVGKIEEISLHQPVLFTYGSGVEQQMFTSDKAPSEIDPRLVDTGQKNNNALIYTWNLASNTTWLDSFTAAGDGQYSVTIRANDTIGLYTIAEWSFFKDTVGPAISFDGGLSAANTNPNVTISGNEGDTIYVSGQFNDIASDIGYAPSYETAKTPSFEYKLYRANEAAPGTWSQVPIATNGTMNGQSATWRVPIPGTYDSTAQYDGPYLFQIRVKDALLNTTTIGAGMVNGVNTGAPVQFVVDRKEPQMISKADGTTTADSIILKGGANLNLNGANGLLAESRRVFSAAGVVQDNTTVVFTLRGLVYEHNLNELNAAIRNRSQSIAAVSPALTGINALPVAWKNSAADRNWYGNGTSGDRNLTGANLRIRRASVFTTTATATDTVTPAGRYYTYANHGLAVGDTVVVGGANRYVLWVGGTNNSNFKLSQNYVWPTDNVVYGPNANNIEVSDGFGLTAATLTNRYVWELDVRQGDFWALRLGSQGAEADDSTTRMVSITARDLARKNSTAEDWQFKLDSAAPTIDFSNVDQQAPVTGGNGTYTKITTLEDASITLSGTAEDKTNISRIEYMIEKYNFTAATPAWTVVTPSTTGLTGGWRAYTPVAGDSNLVSWSITNAATGSVLTDDGLYRLSVRAADFSLSNNAGGNLSNPVASREFFVDRNEPLITWNPAPGTFYRWDSTDKIVFNLTVADLNTLKVVNGVNTWTGDLRGVLREFTTSGTPGTQVSWPAETGTSTGKVLVNLTYAAGAQNATSTPITVTIDRNGVTLPNMRYVLTLTIKDKAGHTASIGQVINFYLDNTAPGIGITPNNFTEAITGRVQFQSSFTKTNPDSPVARVAYAVTRVSAPVTTDRTITATGGTSNTNPVGGNAATRHYTLANHGLVVGDTVIVNNTNRYVISVVGNNFKLSQNYVWPTDNAVHDAGAGPITVRFGRDAALRYNGWHFNNGQKDANGDPTAANPYKLIYGTGTDAIELMEINEGIAVANILIPDTRNFLQTFTGAAPGTSTYIGNGIPATNQTFNNVAISTQGDLYGSTDVNELKLHLLAIDEAGNTSNQTYTYSIYPAGDYPRVTAINNPSETATKVDRQLNGTIRISGNATDNYRVQGVWFRVLKDGYANAGGTPIQHSGLPASITINGATVSLVGYEPVTNLKIPVWDSFWAATNADQNVNTGTSTTTATTFSRGGTDYGTGWYKANGGGPGTISWWAQINTDGELDPGLSTSRGIIIQTMAEDTIWVDKNNDYAATGIMSGTPKSVEAWVVKGAPVFADEEVQTTGSTEWGNILTSAIKGDLAHYRVVVKHDSGVREIRWTNAPSAANVLPTTNILDGVPHGNVNGTYGIQVTAGPKAPLTGSSANLLTTKTYMVWTWGTALQGVGGLPASGTTETMRFMTFKPTSAIADIGTAVVIEQVVDSEGKGTYEWLVTVDVDTTKLTNNCTCTNPTQTHPTANGAGGVAHGATYASKADYYYVNLEAHEISKSVPLFSRKAAQIPIDNMPPRGIYNHSTSVAGTAPTFGGEAGDQTAPVMGLSRVIMWFSQNNVSIPWAIYERNSVGDYVDMSPKPTWTGGGTAPDGITLPGGGAVTLPSGVTWPVIPAENGATQYNCVVIDRTDQLGGITHHGHKLAMGLQTTGGGLGTAWYASLDSNRFESGRVTAHYIVYDRAGNATYYSQRLMILNGIPRIESITLATDIGTGSLHTGTGLGTLAAGNNNKKNNETNVNTDGAMARIRTAMGAALTTDVARGISEEIPIDTSRPGVYSVVYDRPDFLVRNNLFAIKVNTDVNQKNKTRNYRVEYVSGARNISGTDLIAKSTTSSQSGIRAGKVYIINDVGRTPPLTGTQQRFPWGVLGVQGETYQKGTVFIATVDGDEIGLTTTNFATIYGTPSVWELNGTYYGTSGLTANNVLDRNVPAALAFTGGSDVTYTSASGNTGKTAEFVYRPSNNNGTGAFGTTAGSTIVDFNAGTNGANLDAVGRPKPYSDLAAATTAPWSDVSLFIIKIFDGPETDVFGDFALLSIRVNNNDKTPPYAQLYDMNPKTEGESSNYTTAALAQTAALESTMGANRTKGGLWNTSGSASNVAKSGHVEPRTGTSLTSAQMGGGSGTINRPAASSSSGAYFTVDTVSGDVIVRGYAEDNQRIARVDLEIWNAGNTARLPNNTGANSSFTILTQATKNYTNALQATDANRIKFTETIDLNRHRVEWSYLWSTETTPSDYMVGNVNLRVRAYNTDSALRNIANNTAITSDLNGNAHTSKLITRTDTRTLFDSFNPDFPASTGNFYRYNTTQINIRPYITGFLRNQNLSAHNIRSRQGRHIFYRYEVAVVTGFNLGNNSAPGTNNADNSTTLILPTATATVNAPALRVGDAAVGVNNATTGQNLVAAGDQVGAFGLPSNNRSRYRIFVVPDTAASGNGLVRLTYTSGGTAYQAANTSTNAGERPQTNNRPTAVQPWNIEYNPGREGSELWDDFTSVHIWRSDNAEGTTANSDYSRFPASPNWVLLNPAMSIDSRTGTLYESHGEGGSGFSIPVNGQSDGQGAYNSGTVKLVNNDTTTFTNGYGSIDSVTVAQFRDPIIMTDVYRSPGGTGAATAGTWTAFSIIGRSGQYQGTGMLGGIYIRGPGGTTMNFNGGYTAVNNFIYSAESTWYNASTQSSTVFNPPTTDQFENPHIVTYANGATEHIHVSYYDAKDGSVKYRYNLRGSPALFAKSWVNLDGGFDADDWQAAEAAGNATYTLTQANGSQIPDANYNYLRETYVTNNSRVEAGQPIYMMGSNARNTVTYLYEICAPHAGTVTNIQQPTTTGNFARLPNYAAASGGTAFTITWTASAQSTTRVVNYSTRNGAANPNVGQHNSIAVATNVINNTTYGYPVIAYFDMTNQRLKLAISNNVAPTAATNWVIRDNVIPSGNLSAFGTGPYVSMKIDTGVTPNRVHIAALNSVTKQLVYVTGTLAYSNANPPVATFTNTTADVQVVDSVGDVGKWCSLSLDAAGNPWISYQDEGYRGSRDGVKVAYKNTALHTKGGTGNYAGQDTDINGTSITGWEAMHVPTQFKVEDSRLGMECFPARNNNPNTGVTKTWSAVSYLATDYYRIAYYVK